MFNLYSQNELPGRPIFVGYPIAFDFSFVVYYLERFTGKNPFGFSAIDLRNLWIKSIYNGIFFVLRHYGGAFSAIHFFVNSEIR